MMLEPSYVIAFCSFIALIIAVAAAIINSSVNLRNKRIDIIVHCNSRYEELYKLRDSISVVADDQNNLLKSYYRRYWGLKGDQLDYWLAGYVDPETIISWFMSTANALSPKDSFESKVGLVSYRNSWKEIREEHKTVDSTFVEIVDKIYKFVSEETDQEKRYAVMYNILQRAENKEKILIKFLSRLSVDRLKLASFKKTLSMPVQNHIKNIEDRRKH